MTPTVGRSRAVSFVLLMVRVSASCSIWPMTVPLGRHGCVSVNSDDSLSLVVEVRKNSKFTGLKFDRVYLLITFCSDQSFYHGLSSARQTNVVFASLDIEVVERNRTRMVSDILSKVQACLRMAVYGPSPHLSSILYLRLSRLCKPSSSAPHRAK